MKSVLKIAFGVFGAILLSTALVVGLFASEAGRRWYRDLMFKLMASFMED